jgi:NAD(P)-dependent dehydrogenase (short-subunit alcohol dehydrogenase family)
MMSDSSPVWFITGCSTGFGRELARLVLDRGWCVVVTARDTSRYRIWSLATRSVPLALALDVTDASHIKASARAAEERFGAIESW